MDPRQDAALDWAATPWVGPSAQPAPPDGPSWEGPSGRPPAARGARRPDRTKDDRRGRRSPAASDSPGRRSRRRAGPDDEVAEALAPVPQPAAAPRRRAAGTVGRRTVSQRAPRELTPEDDAVEVARQVCLDQLSYTARTRAELATALDHRGVPADAAAQVLDRFTEVGLIDDVAFAQAWVARRGATRAGRALAQELRRRGVADETAAAALATLDPDDEVEAARALVDRKLRSTVGTAPDVRIRRLVGMLARKGYGAGLAFRVVREALAAEGVEVDEDGAPDD